MVAKIISIVFAVMMLSVSAGALEMAGVDIPETITQTDGTPLVLNGAGIRSKFVFKVYIAQLYLKNPAADAPAVLKEDSGKRMAMHFLHSKVGKDDLVKAWNEGFEKNGTKEQLEKLKDKIDAFNAMFDTVKTGDEIILDYIPGTGTTVMIRGEEKGVVKGKEFNDLMLSIWIGEKPVTDSLKKALLGK
jgi:hypothetical protein